MNDNIVDIPNLPANTQGVLWESFASDKVLVSDVLVFFLDSNFHFFAELQVPALATGVFGTLNGCAFTFIIRVF